MNLLPYIEHLHSQLLVAAEAGGDDAKALAARLLGPLESATRLVLLDALSAAADEITQEIAPGSVDVRLRGTEPEFVVSLAQEPAPASAPTVTEEVDEGTVSRTTLRLPEQLKSRVEQAAARDGLSVNTWLVRAIAAGVEGDGGRRPSRPSIPGQSYTGWARS